MTWKEILEVTATVLTILVSLTVLYGAFKGIKNGFFHKLHRVLHHHAERLAKEKAN